MISSSIAASSTRPPGKNREIMAAIKRNGETRAEQGIAELAADPTLRVNGRPAQETRIS